MPYDPTIALRVAQPQFDPATAMQNALAIRNARLQEQANQLKLQQEQQAMQEAAGLQNYLASADLSKPEGMSGLLKYGTAGATVAKTFAERQAAEALTTQRGEEAKKSKFEAASKRQEFVNQAMQDMAANPSDANITAWAQDSVLKGLFAQDEADSLLQQTLAIPLDQRKSVFTQLGMSGKEKADVVRQTAQTKNEEEQRRQEDARIALERRRVQIAEAQNKRDQATFDLEQSTAGQLGITPKVFKQREAAYPEATRINQTANNSVDAQIADLKALRDHPGLSAIAGPYDTRTKSLQFLPETVEAQALFDKVRSGQTFQALIDLRKSSPTGAGVSGVSDSDLRELQSSTGINQNQYAKSLQKQINENIDKLEKTKSAMNTAYTETYKYKAAAPPATDDKAQTQKLEDPLGIRKSKAK